ncbi:hypothetical protein IKF73_02590 [Candidatus Saccharibacteria bacterium]|nr:hypothetical protein [Candidatus Saccharibacteria bacterium]
MDNFSSTPKYINYPVLIFSLFEILFLALAIPSMVSLINRSDKIDEDTSSTQPHITIANLETTLPDFPSTWKDILQNQLLDIVQANDANVNIADVKAEIRSDTAHANYFSFEDFYAFNAIVDLPELGQSYQFFFEYSDEENNSYVDLDYPIVFLCVTNPSDIIYPDFNCTDLYGQQTRTRLVAKYLWLVSFDQFRASINESNYQQVTIRPYDLNDPNADLFIEQTKQAITALGGSPDSFDYYIDREPMDYIQDL